MLPAGGAREPGWALEKSSLHLLRQVLRIAYNMNDKEARQRIHLHVPALQQVLDKAECKILVKSPAGEAHLR